MRAFLISCVLAACASGHAADTVIYYGPNGEVLANGRYTRVTISWVNGQPVMSQQVVLDVGGGVVPPGPPLPPVPPVSDLDAKIVALIAQVNDPDKAATSAKLAETYRFVAALGEAGSVTDVAKLRESAERVSALYLGRKDKAIIWQPFTAGMASLTAPMDFAGVLVAYNAAETRLLSLQPPDPPQPPPLPPVTSAAKVLILIPPELPDQELSLLTNQSRNDKAWSKKILILNSDAKDENKSPDPLVTKALAYLSGRPLPRILLLDAAGSFVADDAVPATWEAAKAYLTQKGVSP
jgi:hypothetical protein